jgi:hypothetical protein
MHYWVFLSCSALKTYFREMEQSMRIESSTKFDWKPIESRLRCIKCVSIALNVHSIRYWIPVHAFSARITGEHSHSLRWENIEFAQEDSSAEISPTFVGVLRSSKLQFKHFRSSSWIVYTFLDDFQLTGEHFTRNPSLPQSLSSDP